MVQSSVTLDLRYLRTRPTRAALAVVGVFAATTLIAAFLCIQGSLSNSVTRFETAASAGADLQVMGLTDTGVPETALPMIASLKGVSATAPLLLHPVVVNHHSVDLIGIDSAIESFVNVGNAQQNTGIPLESVSPENLLAGPGIAETLGIHRGSKVLVYGGTAHRLVRVAGVFTHGLGATFDNGYYFLTGLSFAQTLTGMPQAVDSILVKTLPHVSSRQVASQIRKTLGGRIAVSSPSELVRLGLAGIQQLLSSVPVVSVAVVLIASFLVFNTMSMLARDRRSELATLRALGARRRQVVIGFVVQALLLGAIGSAIGTVIGVLVGDVLVHTLPPFFLTYLPAAVSFSVPVSAPLTAVAAGIAAALAAAVQPAVSVSRVAPVEAMKSEEGVSDDEECLLYRPRLAALSLTAIALGSVIFWLSPKTMTVPGIAMMIVGWVLLTYAFAPILVGFACAIARGWPRTGELPSAGLARSPRHVWGTTSAIAASVALVVCLAEVVGQGTSLIDQSVQSLRGASAWVTSAPANALPNHVLLPTKLGMALRQRSEVARVIAGQFCYVRLGSREILLQGVEARSAAPILAEASSRAQEAVIDGRGVTISSQLANSDHLRAGDPLDLQTPVGVKHLVVSAVVVSLLWPEGTVGISLSSLQSWYGRYGASWYEIDLRPGFSPSTLIRGVNQLVRSASYPAYVYTGAQYFRGATSSSEGFVRLVMGVELVALVVGALAILNTLMLLILGRRRELGVFRAVGMSRAQLSRTIKIEGISMGIVGAVTGVPFGLIFQMFASHAESVIQEFPILFRVRAMPIVVTVVIALAVAVLGAWWPARQAARLNVIEAIGYE